MKKITYVVYHYGKRCQRWEFADFESFAECIARLAEKKDRGPIAVECKEVFK